MPKVVIKGRTYHMPYPNLLLPNPPRSKTKNTKKQKKKNTKKKPKKR